MSRSTLFALLAVTAITACSGKLGGPPPQPGMDKSYTNSVGFTGVGANYQ